MLTGDEAAWRVLYDRCFNPLYAHVMIRTGSDRQKTEEIVQECWLVAVRRIRKFDPAKASFLTWMKGIAENTLRNYNRKWLRRQKVESPSSELDLAQDAAGISAQLAQAEQIGLVLASLPARYQDVLKAKYEEQLAVNEIAQRWKNTPKAVESLLSRARKAFREAYGQLEEET